MSKEERHAVVVSLMRLAQTDDARERISSSSSVGAAAKALLEKGWGDGSQPLLQAIAKAGQNLEDTTGYDDIAKCCDDIQAVDADDARRLVAKLGRSLARPGELSDPVAARFWSTSFMTNSGATQFDIFFEKFFRFARENNFDDYDLDALSGSCDMKCSVVLPLRQHLVGSSATISPTQLQDAIDASTSYAFPQCVLSIVHSLAKSVPPLDSAFRRLIDECQEFPCGDTTADDVKTLLRDNRANLHAYSKLPTTRLVALLQEMGLREEVAEIVAFRVFKQAREYQPNRFEMKSKLQQSTAAIANDDLYIDLSYRKLDAGGVQEFITNIIQSGVAEHVNLGGNNLHRDGANHVARLIAETSSLRALELFGNNLQPIGLEKVFSALTDTRNGYNQVHTLDISECHGTPVVAQMLPKVLQDLPNLTDLCACANDFGEAGASAIAECLAVGQHRLRRFSVAGNGFGDEGAVIIARNGIAVNNGLTYLDLRNNRIGERGMKAIAAAVGDHPTLCEVDLRGNQPLSAEALAGLSSAARRNTLLKSVLIDGDRTAAAITTNADGSEQHASEDNNVAALRRDLADAMADNAIAEKTNRTVFDRRSMSEWSSEEVASWALFVLHRKDISDAFRAHSVDGARLKAMTPAQLSGEGIGARDHSMVLNAVAKQVGMC